MLNQVVSKSLTRPEMLSAVLDNPAIVAQPIVEDRPPEGAARAQRYRVTLPLQYRREGAPEWYSGFIENLSRSGMLFRFSEDPLGLAEEGSEHRRLELSLKLLRVGCVIASGPFRCHGAVVRFETPGKLRTQPAVAVAFDASRTAHRPRRFPTRRSPATPGFSMPAKWPRR